MILLFLLSALTFGATAHANVGHLSVVAVVGETPISNLDLVDRAQLIIRSSGLTDSPEIRKKVTSQAMKQLVDERLQAIDAKKRGVVVSGEEMAAAIGGLEQQNGQAPGSLQGFMVRKGVAWEAFTSQLRAQLLWNKMMAKVIRPKVRISEADFERSAKNQRLVESGQEYNITPLVLTIDSPEKEAPLFALAQKIVEDVRGGAQLEAVMQQLMKVPAGKEPRFWVTIDQLEPSLAAPLQAATPGELIGPIRSERGIHIMRVNEVRAKSNVTMIDPSQVILKEILLSLRSEATPKEVTLTMNIAQQVARNPGTCLEPSVAGIEEFTDTDIKVSFLQSTVSDLPAYARQQTQNLDVGSVGEPFATPQGIRFYILCEKVEMPAQVLADEGLRERLFREKLDLEASKFMRALRRENFIEIRT
ncbi:MAG: SurA N-terminal domain-containing protein [Rickettsiales bacterium]|nr:SurA N-terminal domain-containing protein [Rickettsiales bacterium]